MKKIKIKFSGFGGRFDDNNNFIINVLRKYYEVELSDKPDYLFFSVNSTDYLEYKDCVKIFYTAENIVPDFNVCDYGIGYNYIDFEDRYIRYPIYMIDGFIAYDNDDYKSDLKRALEKHINVDQSSLEREFCSFVYSNSEAVPCREKFFDKLNEYKTINSGGRYRNNVGGPVASKYDFQKNHKFVLAFENTSSSGYTTEKIVHAFSAGTVPIYWGNPEVVKEFNSKSFINCNSFGLTEIGEDGIINEIIDKIREIDNNDELYLKMLAEPAFNDDYNVDELQKRFEEFLKNIIDQEKSRAYRRNRYYYGERYIRKQKIGLKFYLFCRKFIPIRDFFRRKK